MSESFVGVKEPMPAGEQITFQPAEERMLGKHFHHAPIGRELTAVGVLR